MRKPAKILVTGFSPFLGEQINPSAIILDWIQNEFGARVDTALLPVSFQQAPEIVRNYLSAKSYDMILMLGQAGGRARISLERVALNWVETDHPDEEAFKPQQGGILQEGEPALFSSLPLTEWKEKLQSANLPVEISLSAGGYVCNFLYYQTLHWLQENQKAASACFIHVPYLPQQVVDKGGVPSMELETMKAAISDILKWHL
jgi:pyroglutamyl-peptidase